MQEIIASSGDALRDLPHDHCARYLAHARAEAFALLGDKQGLLETWNRYRSYFDCKEQSNEWFEDRRRPLLTDIPMMVRYLEQSHYGLYRRAVWRLRWRHISWSRSKPINPTGPMHLPWWAWVIFIWTLLELLRTLEIPK